MSASSRFGRRSLVLGAFAVALQAAGVVSALAYNPVPDAGQRPPGASALAASDLEATPLREPAATTTTTSAPEEATPPPPPAPAPTTSTPPVAPATTAAPPPPPPTTGAPQPTTTAPPPAPAPAPAPPQRSPLQRVHDTYPTVVPSAWRSAIAVRFEIVKGNVSWAEPSGRILVSEAHANGSDRVLKTGLAHEFGHLIAFKYGSRAYNGAAPSGWPEYSDRPEEAWADCVTTVFTGVSAPPYGLPPCAGESLSWTRSYLASGPPW